MTLDSIQRLGVVEKIQMMLRSEANGERKKGEARENLCTL
jgi:hypothetical protein